jgi:hypothetical protein
MIRLPQRSSTRSTPRLRWIFWHREPAGPTTLLRILPAQRPYQDEPTSLRHGTITNDAAVIQQEDHRNSPGERAPNTVDISTGQRRPSHIRGSLPRSPKLCRMIYAESALATRWRPPSRRHREPVTPALPQVRPCLGDVCLPMAVSPWWASRTTNPPSTARLAGLRPEATSISTCQSSRCSFRSPRTLTTATRYGWRS